MEFEKCSLKITKIAHGQSNTNQIKKILLKQILNNKQSCLCFSPYKYV